MSIGGAKRLVHRVGRPKKSVKSMAGAARQTSGDALVICIPAVRDLHLVLVPVAAAALDREPERQGRVVRFRLRTFDLLPG